MVRRQAVIDVEGFDSGCGPPAPRAARTGCFNSRVAETYRFTCVPEDLVGYRYLPDSMSANRQRMLRSHILMCRQMIAGARSTHRATLSGLQAYCAWLLREAIAMREPRQLWALWYLLWRENRAAWRLRVLWRDLLLDPVRWLRNGVHRLHRSRTGGAPFAGGIAPGRRFLGTTRPSRRVQTVCAMDMASPRRAALDHLDALLRLAPKPAWATPALVALGLAASLAETLGITLIVAFVYAAMGSSEQATYAVRRRARADAGARARPVRLACPHGAGHPAVDPGARGAGPHAPGDQRAGRRAHQRDGAQPHPRAVPDAWATASCNGTNRRS